jgi:hypothetical protein
MTPRDEATRLAKGASITCHFTAQVVLTLSVLDHESAVVRIGNTGHRIVLALLDVPEAAGLRPGVWVRVRGQGSIPRDAAAIDLVVGVASDLRLVAPPELQETSLPEPVILLA